MLTYAVSLVPVLRIYTHSWLRRVKVDRAISTFTLLLAQAKIKRSHPVMDEISL